MQGDATWHAEKVTEKAQISQNWLSLAWALRGCSPLSKLLAGVQGRLSLLSCARSLSTSPESSGRGRANFLQRLSSTLRDRSSRGFKKEESSSSAQDRARYELPSSPFRHPTCSLRGRHQSLPERAVQS